jgi:hypothetical protein
VTEWHFLLYGACKVLAYCAVCHAGLRWVAARQGWLVLPTVGLGVLRVAMGLAFGVGIFFASAWVVSEAGSDFAGQALAYLLVYVPVRWVEWALIAWIAVPAARSWRGFVLGAGGRDRIWRAAGIAVSCLADVPVLLATGGLPIGRFMC